ncbi:anillin isoform X2 [Anabrus simplex]|uniref:anillin isoform X2 n=1 Tax=Anabrus simplex TaxID=316456 RepID=UPI0035A39448
MEPFTLRMMQRARAQKLDGNSIHWIPEKRTQILQAINRDLVPKPGCMEEIYSLHEAVLKLSYAVDESSIEAQDIFRISNKDNKQNIFSFIEIDMETVAKDYQGSVSSNSSSDSAQETVKNGHNISKSEQCYHSPSCESVSVQEIFQQTVENGHNVDKSGDYLSVPCEDVSVQEIVQQTVEIGHNISKSGRCYHSSPCEAVGVQEIVQHTVEYGHNISKSGDYHCNSPCEAISVKETLKLTVENGCNINKSGENSHNISCESENSFVKNELWCSVEEEQKGNESIFSSDIYNSPLNACEISQKSYFSCNEPLDGEFHDPLDSGIAGDASECRNIYYKFPQSAFADHPGTSGMTEKAESNISPETQYILDRFLKDALGDENLFSSENEESCRFSPVRPPVKEEMYLTVSDYRKLLRQTRQKIRSPLSKSSFLVQEFAARRPQNPEQEREKTLQKLFQQIAAQRKILDQAKKAKYLCSQSRKYRDSDMIVECERIILLTCNKIEALRNEIDRVKTQDNAEASSREEGSLTVTEITLLLQDEHAQIKAERDSIWYVCVLSHHGTVFATPARSKIRHMKITFQGNYTFSNLSRDFMIDLKVYSYCQKRADFSLEGTTQIGLPNLKNTFWNLKNVPATSPLARVLTMTITSSVRSKITVSGFLNYCLEREGPKIWDRKWFFLDGHLLKFWNSPDDQESKAPQGIIDILSCTDGQIKQTDSSSCARPWTFLIQTGDNRHFLEADRKWEMTEWCSFLNEVLAIYKAWDVK